ncbi:MAG: electron transport complex subunit RsxG [Rhodospirillales bacterium]|nr:electron transport complex subunit RsxG [Rhodospirillales bacterium]
MSDAVEDATENAVEGKGGDAPMVGPVSRLKGGVLHQAALLGVFALVAALFLALGDRATEDAIALRQAEDLKASIGQVIPPALHDNDLLNDVITVPRKGHEPLVVYQAWRDGRVVAVAYEVDGSGYAGSIRLIVGIDRNGEILGVRVLSHQETPGLGDKIEVAKDPWILGFDGLSFEKLLPDSWKVKKDGGPFDQFSGATITPRAVVRIIKESLDFFAANRDVLLAPPPAPVDNGVGNDSAESAAPQGPGKGKD